MTRDMMATLPQDPEELNASNGTNGKNGAKEPGMPKTELLPTDYKELYVVITEGREDFISLAERLRTRLTDVVQNGEATVLIANSEFNAVRIARSYGHVPLVMMIGNKSENGQAYPVHGFISAAYENLATVHNALIVRTGERAYKHVDKLGDEATLDKAVDTILWEREESVLPARERAMRDTSINDLARAIERQFDPALSIYPSVTKVSGKPPRIVKIGGSMYDLSESREGGDLFSGLVERIAQVIKEGSYNIILTVGGGPSSEPVKQASENLQISPEQQRRLARMSFRQQASTLVDLLSKMGAPATIVSDTRDLQYVESIIKSGNAPPRVPVVLNIPNGYPSARFSAPAEKSDELSVALADMFGEPVVTFVKDTDGVYTRDPHLQRRQVAMLPEQFRGQIIQLMRVYPYDFLAGNISRKGSDGRDQHLVENSALYVLQRSMVVGSIQVVNGRNPEEVVKAITTIEPVGAYILNQNTMPYNPSPADL